MIIFSTKVFEGGDEFFDKKMPPEDMLSCEGCELMRKVFMVSVDDELSAKKELIEGFQHLNNAK